jgi:hypothetical protein
MVDVTLSTSTKPVAGAINLDGVVSYEAIDAGSAVYRRADGTWAKSRANVVATARVDGFAVSTCAAAGQRFSVVERGDLTTSGLTAGQDLYLSAAVAGKICPRADLVATNYIVYVGTCVSTTVLRANPVNTGIQVP